MNKLVVASAQQQMRLFESADDYRKELSRFLYMGRAKGVHLMVFPALAGVMAAAPLIEGFRVNLLKQADNRHRRQHSLWARTRGALAGSTAGLLKADFRKAFTEALRAAPESLASAYETTFGELAQDYQMTIVAGSAYLPDADGVIRHRVTVFGPDGRVLGCHAGLALAPEDKGLATTGDTFTVVDTPAGRLGILLGQEALYPEVGRVLAYQGAELFVTLAAASNPAEAAYVRQATMARAQDNMCFALTSFLVGSNHLATGPDRSATFVGKSGIYAPLEMTPRYSGVLAEMGTDSSEGLLTAELDREQLHKLWQKGVELVRSRMPVDLFASYLPALYGSRRSLDDAWPETESARELPAPIALPALVSPTTEVEAPQDIGEATPPAGETIEDAPTDASAATGA